MSGPYNLYRARTYYSVTTKHSDDITHQCRTTCGPCQAKNEIRAALKRACREVAP